MIPNFTHLSDDNENDNSNSNINIIINNFIIVSLLDLNESFFNISTNYLLISLLYHKLTIIILPLITYK